MLIATITFDFSNRRILSQVNICLNMHLYKLAEVQLNIDFSHLPGNNDRDKTDNLEGQIM